MSEKVWVVIAGIIAFLWWQNTAAQQAVSPTSATPGNGNGSTSPTTAAPSGPGNTVAPLGPTAVGSASGFFIPTPNLPINLVPVATPVPVLSVPVSISGGVSSISGAGNSPDTGGGGGGGPQRPIYSLQNGTYQDWPDLDISQVE